MQKGGNFINPKFIINNRSFYICANWKLIIDAFGGAIKILIVIQAHIISSPVDINGFKFQNL